MSTPAASTIAAARGVVGGHHDQRLRGRRGPWWRGPRGRSRARAVDQAWLPPLLPSSARRLPAASAGRARGVRVDCVTHGTAARPVADGRCRAGSGSGPWCRAAQRLAGHGVDAGAGRIHPLQMVPPAAAAHLDDVTDDRLLAAPVAGELGLGGHAAATGRQLASRTRRSRRRGRTPRRWGTARPSDDPGWWPPGPAQDGRHTRRGGTAAPCGTHG